MTGPLWLLPGVVATWLSLDAVIAAKLVGLLCMAGAVGWTVELARGRAGGSLAAPAVAAVTVVQPSLLSWSSAGLETGAACLCLVGLCTGLARRAWVMGGLFAAALPWLRPELAPCVLCLLGAGVARDGSRAWGAVAIPVTSALALLAFRFVSFGHALPLSLAAKPALVSHGLDYVWRGLLLSTAGVGLWLALAGARGGRVRDRVLGVALLLQLLGLVLAGGDWMPGFRLLCPLLLPFAYLVGLGFSRWWTAGRRVLALATLGALIAVQCVDLGLRVPAAAQNAASRAGPGQDLRARLRQVGGPIALVDVGFLAYDDRVRAVDLGGVTDPELGRLRGGHLDKRVPERLLRRRDVRAIVLHSRTPPRVEGGQLGGFDGYPVERRVARMPWVRRHFSVSDVVAYASGYHYVVLERQ